MSFYKIIISGMFNGKPEWYHNVKSKTRWHRRFSVVIQEKTFSSINRPILQGEDIINYQDTRFNDPSDYNDLHQSHSRFYILPGIE